MFGFTGRILRVNLSAGAIEIEEPPEAFYRQYLGGSLMGAYYLLKHTPPGADPLGPENTLSFMLPARRSAAKAAAPRPRRVRSPA